MGLDLNLLRTFLSIYETRSVTRAAEQLALTQPTVSHALGRLRRQLGDPLFVRGAGGLEPTARAGELALVFRKAVASIDEAVESNRSFDPATTARTFRLCLSDIGELTFLPPVMARLARQAPQASISSVPMDVGQLAHRLARGEVDAAIASIPLEVSGQRRVIRRGHYVCILPGNLARPGPAIGMDQFLELRHVAIDPAAGHQQVDALLESLKIERRIGLYVHHFSVLPNIVVGCGMAAIVPLQLAVLLQQQWPIAVRELPVEVPYFDVTLYWNEEIA
ncbi:LysR family transcriptional regulator, partial [Arthrobacter deserti]|nr:LysR family transcriptional regulator [Arthrobacter deserti]